MTGAMLREAPPRPRRPARWRSPRRPLGRPPLAPPRPLAPLRPPAPPVPPGQGQPQDQPGLAPPRLDPPGSPGPDRARPAPDLARPGLLRPGPARPGLLRPGLARPGLLRPGLARPEANPAPPVREPAELPGSRRRSWPLLAGASLAWLVAGLALFSCFLHMSRGVPVNADGASNALQAWAMLHGNPLLRGWYLSDVSFYTTELPQYMLIELARGLTPDVVHVAAAMTYTLVVLLAARLAKGSATGTHGVLRAFIAAGIMIAPQQAEVTVLMLSPDHVGSTVPILAMWLLIDRAGRRWFVPPACCLLLGLALVADEVVLLTGVLPLLLVAVIRAYRQVITQRGPVRSVTFELGLAAAAAAGAEAGWHALALIRSAGGFVVWPPDNQIAGLAALPHNLLQTYQGILLLFGADFMGQPAGLAAAIALIHLAGIGLAAWALAAGLRRYLGADIAVQLMVTATVISLAAFAFGPNAGEMFSSREFAAVLPAGAALAGRLLAGRISRARLVPALLAVLAVYIAGAVQVIAAPPAPAANQGLAGWLAAHRLYSGLAGYWLANSVTLDSGGTVTVRALDGGYSGVWPRAWESQLSWYSPAAHTATFVVLPATGPAAQAETFPNPYAPTASGVIRTFGQPAEVYFLTGYTVLVWNKNLLAELG
jgi:hypothetical protein